MRVEPAIPADVLGAVRAPFLALGATAIDPPLVQPLGLILDLSGEAMRERLILVQNDREEGALRPDFTIPAASARPRSRSFTVTSPRAISSSPRITAAGDKRRSA